MAGKVEKQVRAILAADPDNGFTVEDLCERVYGESPEKKHRVSMLRVIKRISEIEPHYALMTSERPGGPLVLYDCGRAHAYAMARLKAESSHYRRKYPDWWRGHREDWRAQEEAFRQTLQPEGEHYGRILDGGTWWRFARMEYLARTGENPAELDALKAADERQFEVMTANLRASLRGEPPSDDQARQGAALLARYFERTGNREVVVEMGGWHLRAEKLECFQQEPASNMETKQDCFHAEAVGNNGNNLKAAAEG